MPISRTHHAGRGTYDGEKDAADTRGDADHQPPCLV